MSSSGADSNRLIATALGAAVAGATIAIGAVNGLGLLLQGGTRHLNGLNFGMAAGIARLGNLIGTSSNNVTRAMVHHEAGKGTASTFCRAKSMHFRM